MSSLDFNSPDFNPADFTRSRRSSVAHANEAITTLGRVVHVLRADLALPRQSLSRGSSESASPRRFPDGAKSRDTSGTGDARRRFTSLMSSEEAAAYAAQLYPAPSPTLSFTRAPSPSPSPRLAPVSEALLPSPSPSPRPAVVAAVEPSQPLQPSQPPQPLLPLQLDHFPPQKQQEDQHAAPQPALASHHDHHHQHEDEEQLQQQQEDSDLELDYTVPPPCDDEELRQQTLDILQLVDTATEECFDRLVKIASEIFQMPIALVSLIDRDRQWFKAVVGLDVQSTPRSVSFCGHAIARPAYELDEIFEVPDATQDARFARNPLVIGDPDIRFYASASLRATNGMPLGSLCVIDRQPRQLTAQQKQLLQLLGKQVESEIQLRHMSRQLVLQHELSQVLLAATLPAHIVQLLRMPSTTLPLAQHHDDAAVMFVDMVGFTAMSASMMPFEIVQMLSALFSMYDAITRHCGLLKIKTIGDGYLCCGGVPEWRDDQLDSCVQAAALFLAATAVYSNSIGRKLQLRIGLNSGPIVSGVIGSSQVTFDIWGDTVNTASRVESHADIGTLCVTPHTAEALRMRGFGTRSMGVRDIKGKNALELFAVNLPRISDELLERALQALSLSVPISPMPFSPPASHQPHHDYNI
jgi:class 3 adenylate cyclase